MLTERPVSFPSEGALLKGVLITPAEARQRLPTIIMAHGTSATFPMVAIEYARVFARAGLAALIYDHRNFGQSGGQPRQEINPWLQCRGYRDALNFAISLPEVDPDRLSLWGSSYTGGEVVLLSACDARPKVIVAQCPVFGPTPPSIEPSADTLAVIRQTFESGDISGTPETTTGPLPVVSADQLGSPSLLAPIQAFRWFVEYGGRPGSGWENRATRIIPPTPVTYSPYLCAPYVQAKVLFIVPPADEMVHANYQVTRAAYDAIPTTKQWHDIADGHFGLLYHPGPRFDEASSLQVEFLRAHLDV
ncbi:MAG: hypothetical protein KDJ99_20495 [Candidatus Competibacteraceae bacterium]|nr:hypothetical protein [Candidatus Competibacteraceae bacterium]